MIANKRMVVAITRVHVILKSAKSPIPTYELLQLTVKL